MNGGNVPGSQVLKRFPDYVDGTVTARHCCGQDSLRPLTILDHIGSLKLQVCAECDPAATRQVARGFVSN